jgi:wyosine [tRNA(Phe)-imidazoG37] synthetase (radical SAM superfamily)
MCTYNCIYCKLGKTTNKTTERKEWVPLNDILKQFKNKLSLNPDYIIISGLGETTLFSRLGELISIIKNLTDIPIVILTNGSLLWISEVQDNLMEADIVIPSLDVGDKDLFHYVNRPHIDITFNKMVDGLITFKRKYSGQYWLEIFLLGGVTSIISEVNKIAKITDQICPDRIHINTVTEPPAEDFVDPVPKEQIEQFKKVFRTKCEVINGYYSIHQQTEDIIL